VPYNGSGVFTAEVDFTTEAGAPPIEISKLDDAFDDVAEGLSNVVTKDGQTNPSADLKMNGFKHTNVGAATALTHYARVTELIDQDHIFYVDTGVASAYVLTPSPAISAYEEGQRFVFRAANASGGASTLNVNGLGAIAIQTPDGSALVNDSMLAGGIYEVTYDANASPDRWVMTSPTSKISDGVLSSNVPLKNAANTFTAAQTIQVAQASLDLISTGAVPSWTRYNTSSAVRTYVGASGATNDLITGSAVGDSLVRSESGGFLFSGDGGTSIHFKLDVSGVLTTKNIFASEVGYKGTPQNAQDGDYTLVLSDCGKTIYKAAGGSGETITIPENGTVAFPVGSIVRVVNNGGGTLTIAITTDTLSLAGAGTTGSRTLADHGVAVLEKVAATEWFISGAGIS
jgi:hypothetical protein